MPHNLPAVLAKHCRDLAIICGSASKAYAMTGWRCGWTIGPAKMIAACNAIQSHATSNVNSITQKAVVEALTGVQTPVTAMLDELERLVPEARGHFVRGWVHDWNADPYARGAFSHLAPGYVLDFMQYMSTSDKRLHFAGEHTALWTGFIEGALESAERVAEEVMNA